MAVRKSGKGRVSPGSGWSPSGLAHCLFLLQILHCQILPKEGIGESGYPESYQPTYLLLGRLQHQPIFKNRELREAMAEQAAPAGRRTSMAESGEGEHPEDAGP